MIRRGAQARPTGTDMAAEGMRRLILLNTAVREAYPEDSIAPGVVLSHIGPDHHYGSVCRYHGAGRTVVISATARTLPDCITLLARKWAAPKPARDALIDALTGRG